MTSENFVIKHADVSFLEKCSRSLKMGKTYVRDFLGDEFNEYLMSMYGRLINRPNTDKPVYGYFRLKAPYVICRYVDIAVSMTALPQPVVHCFCANTIENHYDRLAGSDYAFCKIDEYLYGEDRQKCDYRITFATNEFSELIDKHILLPEELLSPGFLAEAFSSTYPMRKIVMMQDRNNINRPFSLLAIPSGRRLSRRSILLFLCMLPKIFETSDFESLTVREIDVLSLISMGLTNKNIALKLSISESAVKRNVHNIFGKLGINSRTDLYGLF